MDTALVVRIDSLRNMAEPIATNMSVKDVNTHSAVPVRNIKYTRQKIIACSFANFKMTRWSIGKYSGNEVTH